MKARAVIVALVFSAAAALPSCNASKRVRPDAPRPRIVSFSPALTQILFDMGLGDHVVGVTRWCILPVGEQREIVGDREIVSTEAILNVEPDIVVIQQSDEKFNALRAVDPRIQIEQFEIETLRHVAMAIERLGGLAGDFELGIERRRAFEADLKAVADGVAGKPRPRVLFLIGYDRPLACGKGTFVDDMITLAGGANAAAERYDLYANVSNEVVIDLAPQVLICQVDVGQQDLARAHWNSLKDLPAVKSKRVHVIIDRRWTIPSTLSAMFAAELAEMIHPPPEGGAGR